MVEHVAQVATLECRVLLEFPVEHWPAEQSPNALPLVCTTGDCHEGPGSEPRGLHRIAPPPNRRALVSLGSLCSGSSAPGCGFWSWPATLARLWINIPGFYVGGGIQSPVFPKSFHNQSTACYEV